MFGVDIGADAAVALSLGDDMHGECGFTRRLGTVDLDDATAGQTADAEGEIEGEGTGRDGVDLHAALLAHFHDRALAELLLDLTECHVECLVTFHRISPSWVVPESGSERCGLRGMFLL
ncbi:unannotated protein [freshwater metagenome]|uniref:Unannotated protein n=1 Tax=freshwater metagenome TaxID=449393 RepID=A0A6J7KQJ5_9ZZZZ